MFNNRNQEEYFPANNWDQSAFSRHNKISILKLDIRETGSYNTAFSRPYETNFNGSEFHNLLDRISASNTAKTNSSKSFSPELLSGLSYSLIKPSANPRGELIIPNGWDERRMLFVLQVSAKNTQGTDSIYYFQGYTTHSGISLQGSIDPNMYFFINSYIKVRRNNMGMGRYSDSIVESAQIINGEIFIENRVQNYLQRPCDVFMGMQSNFIASASNYTDKKRAPEVNDTRITVTTESVKSNRSNNVSSKYMSKILAGYNEGVITAEFGQGTDDILSRSRDVVAEHSINENPFLRALSIKTGVPNISRFTFDDLMNIDPGVDAVTNVLTVSPVVRSQMHQAGQTSFWNGSDISTLTATVLSNSVPSLMMELFLTEVSLTSTNHDITGRMNTVISVVNSFTNADLSDNVRIFVDRLEREVLNDITFDNQESYSLSMHVDLMGDTFISIQIADEPMTDYVVPSFCDGLLTPVVTPNKNDYMNLVGDLEMLTNQVTEDLNPVIPSLLYGNGRV